MQVVALSSSRVSNSSYLETAIPFVDELFGTKPVNLAFIPFATVGSTQEYYNKVKEAFSKFPYQIHKVTPQNGKELLESCDGVLVGGGNTFKLLHDLYETNIFELLKSRVREGLPYLGWSAGSNVLGATICTTNDMPIIQPKSFNALNIFPFQINPHYHNHQIDGFNGETRDQRIEEFLTLNQTSTVIAIPEGSALIQRGGVITFSGKEGTRFCISDGVLQREIVVNGGNVEFSQPSRGRETGILQ